MFDIAYNILIFWYLRFSADFFSTFSLIFYFYIWFFAPQLLGKLSLSLNLLNYILHIRLFLLFFCRLMRKWGGRCSWGAGGRALSLLVFILLYENQFIATYDESWIFFLFNFSFFFQVLLSLPDLLDLKFYSSFFCGIKVL